MYLTLNYSKVHFQLSTHSFHPKFISEQQSNDLPTSFQLIPKFLGGLSNCEIDGWLGAFR